MGYKSEERAEYITLSAINIVIDVIRLLLAGALVMLTAKYIHLHLIEAVMPIGYVNAIWLTGLVRGIYGVFYYIKDVEKD